MEDIKSVNHYDSSYDLIVDYYGRDIFCDYAMTDDQINYLWHADDFEALCFYVLNDDTVLICDSISGDVISGAICLEEFVRDSLELAMEEEQQ